ncbi:TPA: hypothetical protein HA253_00995 [Candidatus Woesearchaeota archaeon]|nr:hypothetical protein [Candidatus Woesearchaeota archaeon]
MKEGFRFHWHFLLGSLKKFTHKTTWFVFCYELGFWVLFLVLGTGLSGYLSKSFAGFYPSVTSPAQLANLQGPLTELQGKLFFLIGLVLVYLLLLYVLWIVSRSLMWSTLLSKKWSVRFSTKMLLVQLIWGLLFVLPWFILFRIFLAFYATAPFTTGISALYYLYLTVIILVLIGFLLVYHHFTSTMYFLFTKHGSFLSVLQAYPISFSLVGKAWIPSVYLILAGLLVSIISLVFNIFPEALKSYPTFIIYVLLLTFARVYYRDLLTHWKV